MDAADTVMCHLIGRIYEAALDASLWERELLPQLERATQSQGGAVWAHDFALGGYLGGVGAIDAFHGAAAAAIDSFKQHYSHCNVWMQHAPRIEGSVVASSSDVFPDRELPRTEWYAGWLQPLDLFHSAVAMVQQAADRAFNLTLLRSRSVGPYRPDELQLLRRLLPHLTTAFALHRRLCRAEALAQASLQVLEGLPLGVVLLDAEATVLHATRRARTLAAQGGLLQFRNGARLGATAPGPDARLQRAIREAVATGRGQGTSAGTGLRLDGLAGARLHLLVAPLPAWRAPFGEQAAAAVFISAPSLALTGLRPALQSVYGLTLAEAQLAQALINGLSPQEYADSRDVSVHTVRTQFKAASAKVGVRRQADFVRVLLTGPALLGRWEEARQPEPKD